MNVGAEYRQESLELNPTSRSRRAISPARALRRFRSAATSRSGKCSAKCRCRSSRTAFIEELTFGAGYRKSWYKRQQRPQVRHGHVQDLGRVRADPRHPLPRFVQPRRSRSEHPGAVRAAVRRSRRQQRSVRQAVITANELRLYRAGPGRRSVSRRRTRPASTTACSAATRT